MSGPPGLDPPDESWGPLPTHGTLYAVSYPPHDGTNFEVHQADPRILLTGMFLREARMGAFPRVKVTVHRDTELLTITARNGTWVYVVGPHDPGRDVYLCHWPD